MPAIAITGGVSCGKSTVASQLVSMLLARHALFSHFSADACAHQLLRENVAIREAVLCSFGSSVCDSDGDISRAKIREAITDFPEKRVQLEEILHPAIREAWQSNARAARKLDQFFVAEIPLLFETKAHSHFDVIITAACSPRSQHARLLQRNWTTQQIREILIAQASPESKVISAHFVIWTDVPIHIVGRQTALLADSLLHTFAKRSDFDQPSR
ncbi:MAG: Dephospho-CoA kinase [Verrucomicrobiota bacterium]|jgi:dephospho-CoA kinase